MGTSHASKADRRCKPVETLARVETLASDAEESSHAHVILFRKYAGADRPTFPDIVMQRPSQTTQRLERDTNLDGFLVKLR
ncbi:hypothetical protein KIN20_009672 [Parelaphostrongylus tenuis]|uniref:Uncharacterized protein n=1 Tax=Parelaphostrongylus tenuis TaxID=148309 RepID=A0AAD5QID4_PARTN|nr:hypothetical protein KIN20_009672 [Parelaphostrongylus tenuis]